MKMLTTKEAAEILLVHVSRVRFLAEHQRFPGAAKFGRDWLIPEAAVRAYAKTQRKAGRPRGRAGRARASAASPPESEWESG